MRIGHAQNRKLSPTLSPGRPETPPNYGALVELKLSKLPLIQFLASSRDSKVQRFIVRRLKFRYALAVVKDRHLFKLLKNADFVAGRQLLFKQCREYPADVCLMHNKALMLAFQNQLDQSSQLFGHVEELVREQATRLQSGWQMNWVVVKLRNQDYSGVKHLIADLSDAGEITPELAVAYSAIDEFASRNMLELQKQVSSRESSGPGSSMAQTMGLRSADYEISASKQSSAVKLVDGTFGGGSPATWREDAPPFSLKLASTAGADVYNLGNSERGEGGDG